MNYRPTDIRGMLVETAEVLDIADRAFQQIGARLGIEYKLSEHTDMQNDLRRLAQYFASFPDIDHDIYTTVFGSDEGNPMLRVHKAEPIEAGSAINLANCKHCGAFIHRVPGGQGPTWVHDDTGAVAAPNPKPLRADAALDSYVDEDIFRGDR